MLTIDERYELFKNTIVACSSNILSKNDKDFMYVMFEVLSIDVNSYLHKNTLDTLISEGYIDETIYVKCTELKQIYMNEEQGFRKLPSIEKIKLSAAFSRIIHLADEVLKLRETGV